MTYLVEVHELTNEYLEDMANNGYTLVQFESHYGLYKFIWKKC